MRVNAVDRARLEGEESEGGAECAVAARDNGLALAQENIRPCPPRHRAGRPAPRPRAGRRDARSARPARPARPQTRQPSLAAAGGARRLDRRDWVPERDDEVEAALPRGHGSGSRRVATISHGTRTVCVV